MAYIDQEKKAIINKNVQPILKKYGLKGTLSIRHYSSITLTLRSGVIDFGDTSREVNHYYIRELYRGVQQEVLLALDEAMRSAGHYDNSEPMTDYFDVAYYYHIQLGEWNKPYQLIKQAA